MEQLMVDKLKEECGNYYVKKIETMFKDFRLSMEINNEFRLKLEKIYEEDSLFSASQNFFDMEVHVLTTGFWPITNPYTCQLPEEILCWKQFFEDFYNSKFKGRKLKWVTNLGTANLRGVFNGPKKELICSSNQMCILMLFNKKN